MSERTRRRKAAAPVMRKEAPPPKKASPPRGAPPPLHPVGVQSGPLGAPIETMDLVDVMERLSREVVHQINATDHVAYAVTDAWEHHKLANPPEDRVRRVLLSGPSGSGKTETALRVRHYLGMDKGYRYERQCIWIDASENRDSTADSKISGAAAGYMGCDDGTALAEKLRRAVEDDLLAQAHEKGVRSNSKEHREMYKQQQVRKREGTFCKPPPVILLVIDEVDKPSSNGMVLALNGLLDKGNTTSARGKQFVLPRETALLCIFTANYAAEDVAQMDELASYEEAQALVEQAVLAKGLQKCSLERFGHIAVYYALGAQHLQEILLGKLDTLFGQDPRWSRMQLDNELKQHLVQHLLTYVDPERGTRQGLRIVGEHLGKLVFRAQSIMNKQRVGEELSDEELRLRMHTFSLFPNQEVPMDPVLADVLHLLATETRPSKELERRTRKAERDSDAGQPVHALAVHRADSSVLAVDMLPELGKVFVLIAQDTGARVSAFQDVVEEVIHIGETEHDDTKLANSIRKLKDKQREIVRTYGNDRSQDPTTAELRRLRGHAERLDPENHKRPALENRVEEVETDEPLKKRGKKNKKRVASAGNDAIDATDPVPDGFRRCDKCNIIKSLTEKYSFTYTTTSPTGCRRKRCKDCRKPPKKGQ